MALAGITALALLGIGWLMIVYPSGDGPGRGREVRIAVAPGAFDAAVSELSRRGVIESPRAFAMYARLLGGDERLRSGEVIVTDDMTPRDVLQRIAVGFGSATVRIVIPEGFNRYAIAARLARWGVAEEADFLAATEDRALLEELDIEGPSAEGYLFPDTYRMPEGLGGSEAVRRLVEGWQRRVGPVLEEHEDALDELEEELSFSVREVVILASIVEKEAVAEEERPLIARVFMNRLSDPTFTPKRLQADPSVSYGCLGPHATAPSCAAFDGRHILRSMLQDPLNPYNTYRHEGLPPGPICNPGLRSIRAVLDAPHHDYLYFVARGGGRHSFSSTLEEHNAAVSRYREGRE